MFECNLQEACLITYSELGRFHWGWTIVAAAALPEDIVGGVWNITKSRGKAR